MTRLTRGVVLDLSTALPEGGTGATGSEVPESTTQPVLGYPGLFTACASVRVVSEVREVLNSEVCVEAPLGTFRGARAVFDVASESLTIYAVQRSYVGIDSLAAASVRLRAGSHTATLDWVALSIGATTIRAASAKVVTGPRLEIRPGYTGSDAGWTYAGEPCNSI